MATSTISRPGDIVVYSIECFNRMVLDRGCNLSVPSASVDRKIQLDIGGNLCARATTIDFRNATVDFTGASVQGLTANLDSSSLVFDALVAGMVTADKFIGGEFCGDVVGGTVSSTQFTGPLDGDVCGDITTDSLTEKTGGGGIAVTGTLTGDLAGTFTGSSSGTHTGDIVTDSITHLGSGITVTGTMSGDFDGSFDGMLSGTSTGISGTFDGTFDGTVTGDFCGNAEVFEIISKVSTLPITGAVAISGATTSDVSMTAPVGCFETLQTANLEAKTAEPISIDGDLRVGGNLIVETGFELGQDLTVENLCATNLELSTWALKTGTELTTPFDLDATGQEITALTFTGTTGCFNMVEVDQISPKTGATITMTGMVNLTDDLLVDGDAFLTGNTSALHIAGKQVVGPREPGIDDVNDLTGGMIVGNVEVLGNVEVGFAMRLLPCCRAKI